MQATPREMADLAIALNDKVGFEIHKAFQRGKNSVQTFDQVSDGRVEEARKQLFDQMSALQSENSTLREALSSVSRNCGIMELHEGQTITINGIDFVLARDTTYEVGTCPPLSIQIRAEITQLEVNRKHVSKAKVSTAQEDTPPVSSDQSTMNRGFYVEPDLNAQQP